MPPAAQKWGSVARHGAQVLGDPGEGSASSAWREAVARARTDGGERRTDGGEARTDEEVWIREEQPDVAPVRPAHALRPRHTVPQPVTEEIAEVAGAQAGAKLSQRLAEAVHAYDRDRYQEALRILRPLARALPEAAAVREILGLTLYRMGRWPAALKELEEYRALSESSDQLPVMMDCQRALHNHRAVDALWEELREASPSPEVVVEGRIVMAGSLADRGDLPGAIKLLSRDVGVKKPRPHHLREWYALADLHERAGDVPRARDLFGRIEAFDPTAFDTRDRLRALR
ncbi:MAG TPA: tetratricopeptide repeat protein [Acidimicrobiales bacterium]|nr:tetratricopeptide repeat protein [Acidimicrobiales bacterium]